MYAQGGLEPKILTGKDFIGMSDISQEEMQTRIEILSQLTNSQIVEDNTIDENTMYTIEDKKTIVGYNGTGKEEFIKNLMSAGMSEQLEGKDLDTVYVYQGSSEIDHIEIDKETTTAIIMGSINEEDSVYDQLYTQGNELKIRIDDKSDYYYDPIRVEA